MGRLHNSPKKNCLGVKPGGGILSAAEKRKRMLEAGKKFASRSLQKFSPSRILWRHDKTDVKKSVSESKEGTRNSIAKNFPSNASPTKGYVSCDDEVFKKDETSLNEIMSRRPIFRSTGRPSQFGRISRPSLFRNGINPLDVGRPSIATKSNAPAKPPRTFASMANDSVPSSSKDNTPFSGKGKNVRFADDLIAREELENKFKGASIAEYNNSISFMKNATAKEITDFLKALPKELFHRLDLGITFVKEERRGRGAKRSLFTTNMISTIQEDEDVASSDTNENQLFFVDKTKKEVLSNLANFTSDVSSPPDNGQHEGVERRLSNPLNTSAVQNTPLNCRRPISLLPATSPYYLRSSLRY